MLPKIQYHLTNWIDGMKINRQHFYDSENALIDLVRDLSSIVVAANSYGLLSPQAGDKNSLECNVLPSQSKKYKISVSLCRAITVGGCRIEILPGMDQELVSESDTLAAGTNMDPRNRSGAAFYAVISVNPFARVPSGEAAGDEYPPRNPYAINTYKLNLVPEEMLSTSELGAYHFPVARFILRNDELVRDTNYIPPCAVASAHQGTRQIYNQLGDQFSRIYDYSHEIVQKTFIEGQNTSLGLNIRRICETNLRFVSSEFFFFRTMYSNMSPVYMANAIIQLACAIKAVINVISEKEKEEMLVHFREMNDMTPTKFDEMLANAIDGNYVHDNIFESFKPWLFFLNTWCDLLEKLKDLKLVTRKNVAFDSGPVRTTEAQKDPGKKKFSLLD